MVNLENLESLPALSETDKEHPVDNSLGSFSAVPALHSRLWRVAAGLKKGLSTWHPVSTRSDIAGRRP